MTKKLTQEDFIRLAKEKHGNRYDYSLSEYRYAREPVTIICPVHGEFKQIADSHIRGRGCAKCSAKKLAQSRTNNVGKDFVARVESMHGDHYDLSQIEYKGMRSHVTPICPVHGKFSILARTFVAGSHCQKCSYEQRGKDKADTFEMFVDKAQRLHNDLYEYPQQSYKNAFTHVDIKCSMHGVFSQVPNSHLSGNGCPKCVHHVSSGEEEIANFIKNLDPNLQTSVRSIIPPKEIDMYSEQHKIGIEYCGLYWHAEGRGKNKKYHLEKMNGCMNHEINLITIFEDEWLYSATKVQSRLTQLFGATSHRISARECEIVEMSAVECRSFLDSNHIQGSDISSIRFGLSFQNELVAVMTFTKARFSKKYEWEISRYCSKLNTSVVGGASKLFAHFVKTHNPMSVVTYADLRYGRGDFYKHLGFEHSHDSNPNYWYVALGSTIRESRIKYQKHKLVEQGYDPIKSEWTIMQERGYDRIWDCGNAVWTWTR